MPSYRKKPLAQFEHGTRIYAPSGGESRYRIVATDPITQRRFSTKATTEDDARARAREIDDRIATARSVHELTDERSRTVQILADRYVEDHLSTLSLRYRERQEYLLGLWILPRIGTLLLRDWTAAESQAVLTAVRRAGRSPALVQDVGATMRALVSHARRLRWLGPQSDDPMWMVSYSKRSTIQGASAMYIPRASLPTDAECIDLFEAMVANEEATWALAMRLKHRSGLRWGELTALQAGDISFDPRSIRVTRAVEQGRSAPPTIKGTKNGTERTAIFPRSLVEDLQRHASEVIERHGEDGLLFPGRRGGLMRRSSFQQIWIKAADAAGWPMASPLKRTKGYGPNGRGWRWTGSAKWSPHDLRHVAACWMLFDLRLDVAVVAEKLGHHDPAFTMSAYVAPRGDADGEAMRHTEDW